MKKLVSFCTIVLVVVLLVTTIFSTGCGCLLHSDQPYSPRVTGDGTGGAIAVYEDIKGGDQHDFYVQKISPEGDILWGDRGVLIGGGYKQFDSFYELHIVSDGSGGAVIAWSAYPSEPDWRLAPGQCQIPYVTHVTRVEAEGNILWQKEVRAFDHMISDGAGGAIIATDYGRTLFIIKIDPDGKFPWGEDGVYVYREEYQDNSLQLAGNDAGGAIIIWQELLSEPGPEPHRPKTTGRIFAQRINAEGSLPWGQDGVLLYTTPEEVYSDEAKVASDGSGGAIVVWHRWPRGRVESGMPEALLLDICAQRVDADGNILWQPNGVPLGITKGGGRVPHGPLVVGDGSGGAIIIWEDLRKGLASIYAHRVDTEGKIKWQPGGKEVCYIKTNASFWPRTAVSDGSGGAIIACSYKEAETNERGLLVQRVDAAGRGLWPGFGIVVTGSDHTAHVISHDGYGGAIVGWGSGKSMFKSERSYVQKIDSEGKLLWGEEGIRLNP